MGEHPNVEKTRAALEAFGRGEVEKAADWADDIVWHQPGNDQAAIDDLWS